mmetsp:Transcript_90739/g.292910  ORF Transcript_90739/g.292910 Transcript_90739/m.292910 type:complete len:236 (+) Transcript_90739:910-1617(+)
MCQLRQGCPPARRTSPPNIASTGPHFGLPALDPTGSDSRRTPRAPTTVSSGCGSETPERQAPRSLAAAVLAPLLPRTPPPGRAPRERLQAPPRPGLSPPGRAALPRRRSPAGTLQRRHHVVHDLRACCPTPPRQLVWAARSDVQRSLSRCPSRRHRAWPCRSELHAGETWMEWLSLADSWRPRGGRAPAHLAGRPAACATPPLMRPVCVGPVGNRAPASRFDPPVPPPVAAPHSL